LQNDQRKNEETNNMRGLSPERMMELLAEHEKYEFDNDLDRVMATLVEHPVYELHPQKLRIEGRDAVREFYRRVLPEFVNSGLLKPRDAKPTRNLKSLVFGDSYLMSEMHDELKLSDGNTTRVRVMGFADFEDGKILGERLFSDYDLAEWLDSLLGPDFVDVPGVTTIADEYDRGADAGEIGAGAWTSINE
jgi:hypothetical protein